MDSEFFVVAGHAARYFGGMDEKPDSPWKLNGARIVLLIMGALILLYAGSAVFGGLSNYQQLKEASAPGTEAPAPVQ